MLSLNSSCQKETDVYHICKALSNNLHVLIQIPNSFAKTYTSTLLSCQSKWQKQNFRFEWIRSILSSKWTLKISNKSDLVFLDSV